MKISITDKLLVIRTIILILIKGYDEKEKVYVYFKNDSKIPVGVVLNLDETIIDFSRYDIYETSLKSMLIYFTELEYQNVDICLLIILINKKIRDISNEEMSRRLKIPLTTYLKLERGLIEFSGIYSIDNISKALNIDKEEFYFSFDKSFRKIIK